MTNTTAERASGGKSGNFKVCYRMKLVVDWEFVGRSNYLILECGHRVRVEHEEVRLGGRKACRDCPRG